MMRLVRRLLDKIVVPRSHRFSGTLVYAHRSDDGTVALSSTLHRALAKTK